MKLGTQLYGLLNTQKISLDDLFSTLHDNHIEFVEPCVRFYDMGEEMNRCFFDLNQLEQAVDLAHTYDLAIQSCHIASRYIEFDLPIILGIARTYNIRTFVIGTPEPFTKDALDAAAARYAEIAKKLAFEGCQLLVHNLGTDVETRIGDLSAYEYFVTQAGDSLGMQIDTGWAQFGGADPLVLMQNNQNYLKALHLKDFERPGSLPDTFIGGGVVDNDGCARLAVKWGLPVLIDQDTYRQFPQEFTASVTNIGYYGI